MSNDWLSMIILILIFVCGVLIAVLVNAKSDVRTVRSRLQIYSDDYDKLSESDEKRTWRIVDVKANQFTRDLNEDIADMVRQYLAHAIAAMYKEEQSEVVEVKLAKLLEDAKQAVSQE